MTGLDIRVGDMVRLKPMTVTFVSKDWIDCRASSSEKEESFMIENIESIISRAETPEETIARLEAELAQAPRRIEWGGGECPVDPKTPVLVWIKMGVVKLGEAADFFWKHPENSWSVIAYMVLPS